MNTTRHYLIEFRDTIDTGKLMPVGVLLMNSDAAGFELIGRRSALWPFAYGLELVSADYAADLASFREWENWFESLAQYESASPADFEHAIGRLAANPYWRIREIDVDFHADQSLPEQLSAAFFECVLNTPFGQEIRDKALFLHTLLVSELGADGSLVAPARIELDGDDAEPGLIFDAFIEDHPAMGIRVLPEGSLEQLQDAIQTFRRAQELGILDSARCILVTPWAMQLDPAGQYVALNLHDPHLARRLRQQHLARQ